MHIYKWKINMTYTKKGDKYIFCKDGVYFSMTLEQVSDMCVLCEKIVEEYLTEFFSDNESWYYKWPIWIFWYVLYTE